MNTAERTDEIEIPTNLVKLRTGEAPYPSEEDTLDDEEEALTMSDVDTLIAEIRGVRGAVDDAVRRLTIIETATVIRDKQRDDTIAELKERVKKLEDAGVAARVTKAQVIGAGSILLLLAGGAGGLLQRFMAIGGE